jgi:hypothetical protein
VMRFMNFVGIIKMKPAVLKQGSHHHH